MYIDGPCLTCGGTRMEYRGILLYYCKWVYFCQDCWCKFSTHLNITELLAPVYAELARRWLHEGSGVDFL